MDQLDEQRAEVSDIHVAPSIQTLSDLHTPTSLDRNPTQLWDLDAALVNGPCTAAVDDGSEDYGGQHILCLVRQVEEVVVHRPIWMGTDLLLERAVVDIIIKHLVGSFTEAPVFDFLLRNDGRAGELDEVAIGSAVR